MATFGTGEFGRGKTLLALAVVIGCFAILWPKIFYPMLTSSLFPGSYDSGDNMCCDVVFEKDMNAYKVMNEICANIMRKESLREATEGPRPKTITIEIPPSPDAPPPPKNKWYKNVTTGPPQPTLITVPLTPQLLCRNEIFKTCQIDVLILLNENPVLTKAYKEAVMEVRSFNVSQCLKINYGVHLESLGLPKRFKAPDSAPSHMRPERPIHHTPHMIHPALREKGSAIPHPARRTIDMEQRPGPQAGIRPPMGGGAHAPPQPKGAGTMGIVMPLYTIGIVCFFLYTIMKILFRKNDKEEKSPPRVRDFGMDPEHRKFVFSEDYDGGDRAISEAYNRRDRDLGVRRRSSAGIIPGPIVAMVQDISKPCQNAPIANSSEAYEHNSEKKKAAPVLTAMKGIMAEVEKAQTKPKSDVEVPDKEAEEEEKSISKSEETSERRHYRQPIPKRAATPPPPPRLVAVPDGESEESDAEEESEEEVEEKDNDQVVPVEEPQKIVDNYQILKFAQELSALILKQSIESAVVSLEVANRAEANLTPKRTAGASSPKPVPVLSDKVSVVGMEESVGRENGEKWKDRSPTPTFPTNSRLMETTPPTPVRNIYLEGPLPGPASGVLISDSHCEEIEMDDEDEYEDDEDYDSDQEKPVVLSGKVTLSVLSGTPESIIEAPSLSLDDYARANTDPRFTGTVSQREISSELQNAINDVNGAEVNGTIETANGSAQPIAEKKVVSKEGLKNGTPGKEDDEGTHYTTAEADGAPGGEETERDISAMEGMDEEEDGEEEEEEEYEEEEEEEEEYEEEEDEEEDEEPKPQLVPNKGPTS